MRYLTEKFTIILLTYSVFLLPVNFGGVSIYNYVIFLCLLLNISKFLFLLRKFIVWSGLLFGSVLLTAVGSLDVYLHLQGAIAFLLTLAGIALFVSLGTSLKHKMFVTRVFSIYIIGVFIMVVIEMFGIATIYYVGGERFGLYRPFLFANPIAISTSLLGALLSLKRNYFVKFICLVKLILFASFTSIVMFILTRSLLFKIFTFICVVFIVTFFVNVDNIGSFSIRLLLLGFAMQALTDLDLYGLFFGVGIRNLDIFNAIYGQLTLTNDITFFLKVWLESGLLGLALLLYRVCRLPFLYTGLLTLLFFTSVDQHFYFWSLGFLLVGLSLNAHQINRSDRNV